MFRRKCDGKISGSRAVKSTLLIVSLVAITLCIVGPSLAYIVTTTEEVENIFTASKVSCAVSETINGTTKNDVKIQNTGDTDAYIRATVLVTWKNAEGNVYGASQPVEGTDYSISYNSDNSWTENVSDGFWYCNDVISSGATTNVWIDTCSLLNSATIPDGYQLSVEIIADAIQTNAVTDAWGYTPSTAN